MSPSSILGCQLPTCRALNEQNPTALLYVFRVMTLLRGIMHSLGVDISASTMWRPLALQTISELTRGIVNGSSSPSLNIDCSPKAGNNHVRGESLAASEDHSCTSNRTGLAPGCDAVVVSPSKQRMDVVGVDGVRSHTQSPTKRDLQIEEVGELARQIKMAWVQRNDMTLFGSDNGIGPLIP